MEVRHDLIVGIDPSSVKLALVSALIPPESKGVEDWTRVRARQYDLADKSGPHVLAIGRKVLSRWIGLEKLDLDGRAYAKWCVIEQPVIMGHGGIMSTMVQAYMNGVIQEVFYEAGYTVVVIPPSEWKKPLAAKGGGGASKEAVAERVQEVFACQDTLCLQLAGSQDLADAAAICLFAASIAAENGLG